MTVTVKEAPPRPQRCGACQGRINMPAHVTACCKVCADSMNAAYRRDTERFQR